MNARDIYKITSIVELAERLEDLAGLLAVLEASRADIDFLRSTHLVLLREVRTLEDAAKDLAAKEDERRSLDAERMGKEGRS